MYADITCEFTACQHLCNENDAGALIGRAPRWPCIQHFSVFLRISVCGTCARASSLPAQVYPMPVDANIKDHRAHTPARPAATHPHLYFHFARRSVSFLSMLVFPCT